MTDNELVLLDKVINIDIYVGIMHLYGREFYLHIHAYVYMTDHD